MAKKKSKGTRKQTATRRTSTRKRARARAPRPAARTAESLAGRDAVEAIRALESTSDVYGADGAVDRLKDAVERIGKDHGLPPLSETWHWGS